MPICIVRPTIIGASWKEPSIGWVDTISAGGIFLLSGGLGLLKSNMGIGEYIGDNIPVDLVSNTIISAAVYSIRTDKVNVIHSGSSALHPLSWKVSIGIVHDYWLKQPSKKQIVKPNFYLFKSRKLFTINRFIRRKLPFYLLKAYASISP